MSLTEKGRAHHNRSSRTQPTLTSTSTHTTRTRPYTSSVKYRVRVNGGDGFSELFFSILYWFGAMIISIVLLLTMCLFVQSVTQLLFGVSTTTERRHTFVHENEYDNVVVNQPSSSAPPPPFNPSSTSAFDPYTSHTYAQSQPPPPQQYYPELRRRHVAPIVVENRDNSFANGFVTGAVMNEIARTPVVHPVVVHPPVAPTFVYTTTPVQTGFSTTTSSSSSSNQEESPKSVTTTGYGESEIR